MTWINLSIGTTDVLARRRPDWMLEWVPREAQLDLSHPPGLEVTLTGQPQVAQTTLAPLVLQARLRLGVALSSSAPIGKVPDSAAQLSDVVYTLHAGDATLASSKGSGKLQAASFDVVLPRPAALAALDAFDRASRIGSAPSAVVEPGSPGAMPNLWVSVQCGGDDRPTFDAVSLAVLLTGAVDASSVHFSVFDGDVVSPMLKAYRDMPPTAAPDPKAPMPMVVSAAGTMTPSRFLLPDPSKAADLGQLTGSGAASGPVALSATESMWIGTDAVLEPAGVGPITVSEPLMTDPAATLWADTASPKTYWYALRHDLVVPRPYDSPQQAAFSFVVVAGNPVGGSGGVTQGLKATLVCTLQANTPPEVTAALARLGNPKSQPVPRNELSVRFDLHYRPSGVANPVVQSFQAAVTPVGNSLRCSVALLDDWARLAYSAVSGQADPALSVQVVVHYSFPAGRWSDATGIDVVAGDKRFGYPAVASRSDIAADETGTVFVTGERSLVSPHAELSFPMEVAGAALKPKAVRGPSAYSLGEAMRQGGDNGPPEPRLITFKAYHGDVATLVFPCNTYGALYLQTMPDGSQPSIGCQSALTLGETSSSYFEELTDLSQPGYRVWRSLKQPGQFMVQPAAYRVGRYAANHPTSPFMPTIMIYGVLTNNADDDRYTYAASLAADVSAAQLALLSQRLSAFTPAGLRPRMLMPTDTSVGATVSATLLSPVDAPPPGIQAVGDNINATFTLDSVDFQTLRSMIGKAGLTGAVKFTLSDGTAFSSALLIDGFTTGPADTGPVTVKIEGTLATLTNRTSQGMNVTMLALGRADGSVAPMSIDLSLAGGATATTTVPGTTVSALADARSAQPIELDETDIYVERVSQHVLFIELVNFANHGIAALQISARIDGGAQLMTRLLPEGETVALDFTLPITAFLAPRTLEYTITVTDGAGTRTTPWRTQSLLSGMVVSVTSADLP